MRNSTRTLRTKCLPSVAHFLTDDGTLPVQDSAAALKACHSEIGHSSVDNLDANCVLGVDPIPFAGQKDSSLATTVQLFLSCSQVSARAWRIISATYVGRISSPLCPYCSADEQRPLHLGLPVPTPLEVSSICSAPCEVASFLSTHPSLDYLPPHPWPPPELPPAMSAAVWR